MNLRTFKSARIRGFLVVALIAGILPAASLRAAASPNIDAGGADHPGLSHHEIASMRTATSRTYQEEDGSRTVELFSGPVNYKTLDGAWAPIDDALVSSGRPGYAFENTSGPFRVLFPSDLRTGSIRVESPDQQQWIAFAPRGAASVTPQVAGSTITYPGIFNGVDLTYSVTPAGLKESMILAGPASHRNFVFSYESSPGLVTHQAPGSQLTVQDSWGAAFGNFEAPFMYDARGKAQSSSKAVALDLNTGAAGTTLAINPSSSWMNADRQWPVVIDPTFQFPDAGGRDCWIGSTSPTTSHCGSGTDYLRAGVNDTGEHRRSLIRFDLTDADIKSGTQITSANLALYLDQSQTSHAGVSSDYLLRKAMPPGGAQFTSAATWKTYNGTTSWGTDGGVFGTTDYGRINGLTGATSGWKNFDPSDLVQKWLNGTVPNQGFVLKQAGESDSTKTEIGFLSSRSPATSPSRYPKLTVTYNPPTTSSLSPSSGSYAMDTPTLSAVYQDADVDAAGVKDAGKLTFSVFDTAAPETALASYTTPDLNPGQVGQWTVPSSAGLQGLKTYGWSVTPNDGQNTGTGGTANFKVSGGSISGVSWQTTDVDTGRDDYSFDGSMEGLAAPGGPCYQTGCNLAAVLLYVDGSTQVVQESLPGGLMVPGTNTASYHWSGYTNKEVTDVEIYASPDNTTLGQREIRIRKHVKDKSPDGTISLSIQNWERGADGSATFDLQTEIAHAAQHGGPCEQWCFVSIEGYHKNPDGSSDLVGTLGTEEHRETWHATDSFVGTAAAKISEIEAVVSAEYVTDPPSYFSGMVSVASEHIYKNHDLVLEAASLAPALARNPTFFCTRWLLSAGTHVLRSTLTDQYIACEAAVVAGEVAVAKILMAIYDAGEAPTVDDPPFRPVPTTSPPPETLERWKDETGCEQNIPEYSVEAQAGHIEAEHGYAEAVPTDGRGSYWDDGVPWQDLVFPYAMNTMAEPGHVAGSCERIIHYDSVVGYEKVMGNVPIGQPAYEMTNTYTVVTDETTGYLITAHPGEPGSE
jgi:hypothetical protein